jgi:hypothetical protein
MQVAWEPGRPSAAHERARRTCHTTPPAPARATIDPTGSHQGSPPSDALESSSRAFVEPLATSVDVGAEGVAEAEALVVGEAEVLADGVADADTLADGVADADVDGDPGAAVDACPVELERGLVGVRVGAAVGAGAEDCGTGGAAGAVPGGSAVPPFCHENATVAPAGTFNESTATLEYFHPEVPSDQYRPQ